MPTVTDNKTAYMKTYYAENKEVILEKQAKKRKKNPDPDRSSRKSRLWALYRITPEEQAQINVFEKQHPTIKLLTEGNPLSTDHNHKTGLIRGLLEWRINKAYGLIEKASPENTAEVLRALAFYHENPPAITALGGKRYGLIGKAQYKKKMIYGSENGPIKAPKKARKCKRPR